MAEWKRHLRRAVAIKGSQLKLAQAIGCSQAKISWLLLTARAIEADDAVAVEAATSGAVSRGDLRPDLWPAAPVLPACHLSHVAPSL